MASVSDLDPSHIVRYFAVFLCLKVSSYVKINPVWDGKLFASCWIPL
jgi:hypothetical protein